MSHVATIKLQITDLDALRAAVPDLGAEWREGQTTHRAYYGGQPCLHAIAVPGVGYEVGVVASGTGYDLAFDDYGYEGGGRHDGYKLAQHFGGNDLPKIRQAYATEVARKQLRARGYRVTRSTDQDGSIRLRATR